jgi:hypothetical protein
VGLGYIDRTFGVRKCTPAAAQRMAVGLGCIGNERVFCSAPFPLVMTICLGSLLETRDQPYV